MKFKITVMSSIELVNTCLGLHHWLSSACPAFSKDDIRAMLIRHGLIQREAAENPEGYDNYETWDNVIRFTNELEKET